MSFFRLSLCAGLSVFVVGCEGGAIILDEDPGQVDGAISVTPGAIDFGVVFVGETATETLNVSNVGKKESDVRLELLGDALTEYVLTPYTSAPDPGDTAEHTLTLTPVQWGSKAASVVVEDVVSGGNIEVLVTAQAQEDFDGDGYGSLESGGEDCDDLEVTTYPGADDAWYDGVDSDCEGNDDFDQDGDGYVSDEYGGEDCDDTDESIYPGAEDIWYDGIDSDCAENNDFDKDGDGYPSAEYGGNDCEDEDSEINPGMVDEWYDGVDSDCEGNDDYDQDGDGYVLDDDCNDADESINPGADEIWYDGVDQNCDDKNDYDQDGDGFELADDCDDTDALILGPSPETLDGTDEDCDGFIDDVDVAKMSTAALYGPTAGVEMGNRAKMYLGGDMDSDGVDDFVVLSAGIAGSSSGDNGRAWIVSGNEISSAKGLITDYDSVKIEATSSFYRFGNLSGPMADVNEDGEDDLLATTYYWPSGSSSYLNGYGMYFPSDGLGSSMDTGDADASFTLGYNDASWVAALGDVDGDGAADIVVGSPLDNTGSGGGTKYDCGNVALFLTDGDWDDDYDNNDADMETHGDSSNDYLGYRLTVADVDADGYADILVGAPYNDDGETNGGAVYLLKGSTSVSWTGDVDAEAEFAIYGDITNQNLGFDAFGAPGDNDGDGVLDLTLTSETSGKAWWFGDMASMSGDYDVGDAGVTFSGNPGDFASSVVANSDLDNDGDDELVFGSDSDTTEGTYRGAIHRFDYDASWPATLSASDASATLWGSADYDYLGTGMSGGADLNGDGLEDLLIGSVGSDLGTADGGAIFFVPGW